MPLTKKQHLLVLRFSSLGDVAMTVPVIRLLLHQYPNLEITMVSTEFVRPLFSNIDRLEFYTADIKGRHRGIKGLSRLSKELKKLHSFQGLADLHDVIRTKILRSFFFFTITPVAVINKGRKEKKELTKKHHKKLHPLKSTFQRYADVFENLGYRIELNREEGIQKPIPLPEVLNWRLQGFRIIGIAPFALHAEKTYPAAKIKEVIRLLERDSRLKIFLFGGKNDANTLQRWEDEFSNVQSLAGKLNLKNELHFISNLDVMVSMDSANMHFASMYGVPVVSIWGGTHPYLGFYGWGQKPENAVQVNLECRPSSVFGNKECPRGDLACLNLISPIIVYDKIIQELNSES